MSDDAASQPSARKVGTLRDRIAQFESKPAAPAPPPKPAVPKKTWAWKEKQTEPAAAPAPAPPASAPAPAPSASSSSSNLPVDDEHPSQAVHSEPAGSHAAFSAEDAKASITAGGGLKARLAALQGSGFGAPVEAAPAPPPPSGKPRVWKKVVVPYEPTPKARYDQRDDEDQAESGEHEVHPEEATVAADETEPAPAAEDDVPDEAHDEAEEERQRRAAIAARMARLGGARVGMPMVFGKAPAPPPPKKERAESPPPPPAPAVVERPPSVEEVGSFRPESSATEVTDTTETTLESTEPETSTEDQHSIVAPSSPPRPRPPVPAPRSWSSSPPTSPKSVTRPEIVSQDEGGQAEEVKESKEVDESGAQNAASAEKESKSNLEGEVETAAAVPLPPSRKTTDLSPPSASSSPPIRVPLPAMPKRAAPPRRKIPTPKPSSDAVPKVESPAAELKEEAVVSPLMAQPVSSQPDQPALVPAALDESESPVEPIPRPETPKPDAVQHTAALQEEPPAIPQPDVRPSDVEPAVIEDTAAIEAATESADATAKEDPPSTTKSGVDGPVSVKEPNQTKEGASPVRPLPARKPSHGATRQDSLSRPPPPPPHVGHEASPRPSFDQHGSRPVILPAAEVVEEPDALRDQAAQETERKSRLAERMAKMGGVGMFGAPPHRPSPSRKSTEDHPVIPPPTLARSLSRDQEATAPATHVAAIDVEPPMSPSKRLPPPKRKSLPPPPLPITTHAVEPKTSPAPPRVPLSARPGRTSMGPPARLPPPPPTAPVQGSFRTKTPQEELGALRIVPPSPEAIRTTATDDADSYRSPGELMADADTDPIDPMFYSPLRSPAKLPAEPEDLPGSEEEVQEEIVQPAVAATVQSEETPEAGRKKALAERMAKLGGLSFAAPPGVSPLPRRPPPQQSPPSAEPSADDAPTAPTGRDAQDDEEGEESEEAARARRAAIAARLAAGGGMRLGMLPGTRHPAPPPTVTEARPASEDEKDRTESQLVDAAEDDEEPAELPVPPPPPAHRYAVPPAIDTNLPPPLPPGRHSRPTSALPPTPGMRTPASAPPKPLRMPPTPLASHAPPQTAHGVESHPLPPIPPPPPPPPPPSQYPPVTYEIAPPPVAPAGDWGLPEIPSSSFSEAHYDRREANEPEPEEEEESGYDRDVPSAVPKIRQPLTVPELAALWNRVGLQVITAAKMLVEQSKNTIIGDGTPGGFVETALAAVPSAQPIFPQDGYFGNLIYAQTGSTIVKRSADIMPGDIVALTDVKLKGFKGLQSYNLHIGTSGGPLLAIVAEFEGGKKQKLRVYQAALQANTYPSIEATSYRLEDLKSGTIQIFRVEEAYD